MTLQGITVCMFFSAAVIAGEAYGTEQNYWPGPVTEKDSAGQVQSRDTLGPLIFQEPAPEGERVSGFRPFYVRRVDSKGKGAETTVLYPIYYYRSYGDMYEWSVFKLINRFGRAQGTRAQGETRTFDIWPIYFSRDTGDSATSTLGVFPIAGTAEGLFGYDRISWMLFPIYATVQRQGYTSTYAPWPIVRITRGSAQGFAIWPLYGSFYRPGVSKTEYFLWPLAWNNTVEPAQGAAPGTGPQHQVGILPFYMAERSSVSVNVSYLVPFFGFTDRSAPDHYHETRYFWPFFVQGKGDSKQVDRWGPFYTRSVVKGMDKTWYLWPLVKQTKWVDGSIAQEKNQFFFFLYWNLQQRDLRRPQAAPAQKTCLWPLVTAWDNGAGRRQVEVLSPFEPLFADNPRVREAWSPLFALWRYDQRAPGETRTSLLWNAVTWAKSESAGRSEFHLGPLIAVVRSPASKRVAIAGGLFGFEHRTDGQGWRLFCFEFNHGSRNLYAASTK